MNKRKSPGKTIERTRRTPQKLAILDYLEGNTAHPSAEEIHKALLPRFPTMSLSTVYTTLRALQREGRIHELAVEPGKGRFDPEPAPHHHLVCLECRKVVDVHRRFAVSLGREEAQGFRVLHAHVGFFGICAGCQAMAKTKS
jgi:Fur family transcriptional regulator, peroxide stress response regulator